MTPQQERFAQEVAAGKSGSEAYRIAYPKSRQWKPSALWSSASALLARPKVSQRVDAIRAELAERSIWTREQSVKVLSDVAAAGDKDTDRVRAVAELNKMHGFEAPTKIEHSGGMSINLVVRGIKPGAG